MEYKLGTEEYYRQMLELQDKLRKSEEERIKLEQKFNEIMQQSRDAEYDRLRIMRHKYHKFLEEDKMRQERNENILRTLDRIEMRAKQLAAKTDRFKTFRKQYFENYLKQIPRQQKQQTFEVNTQSKQQPQFQYQQESVCRKLFADHSEPATTATTQQNDNVETKLALLEKYLRDNFDNFPQDFPTSNVTLPKQNGMPPDGKQTQILYDNKNYLDDGSDSRESHEIQVDRYSPSKMNGHQDASEILGNRIEQELERLRNRSDKELNNNSLDAQDINPEQVISDYKKIVSKSEEKFGLKNSLQNGMPKETNVFGNVKSEEIEANKSLFNNINEKENTSLKVDLTEEDNSEDTKPPTDISLNLSSPSQLKEEFNESKQEQIETLPQIEKEENLEISSVSEEITSIEKQKVKPISNQYNEIIKTTEITANQNKLEENVEFDLSNYPEEPYVEQVPSNEFGESLISSQQYPQEQKYPPEEYREVQNEEYMEQQYDTPQEHYDDVHTEYKPNYEDAALQDNTEKVYDEQQYVNPDEQYPNTEHPYQNSDNYENSEYKNIEQFEAEENPYTQPGQEFINPEQQEETSEQQSTKQYMPSEQQYMNPEQYEPSEQQRMDPNQEYATSQQYEPSEQQYVNPEQQYVNPEQQYVNPEQQYMSSEQQEYPPENYDQQYPQQTYQEEEFNSQNYPQEYDTQQSENYDTQNYPQEQYPENYDPQQFTEEQQLEYDQQYPQGEGNQEQQFVENTGEYDPQGQYPESVYQTGQEYLQGEQNVDLQYDSEQQQNYPDGYAAEEQTNEPITVSEETSVLSEQEKQLEDINKPLVQKKLPNLADMLDTDTSESVKPDKVSDSDFDFSNTKT